MNKKIEIALSTITASTLCLQPVMVLADTYTDQPVENQDVRVITSAKDFYESFLCYKTYNEEQVEEYILFENVTEENADALVAAKEFYDSLTPQSGEFFMLESNGVAIQSDVLKADIDALISNLQETNESFNFNEMCDTAKAIVSARVEEEKATVDSSSEKTEIVDETKPLTEESKEESVPKLDKEEVTEDSKENVNENDLDTGSEEIVDVPEQIVSPFELESNLLASPYSVMTLNLMATDTLVKTPVVEEKVEPKVEPETQATEPVVTTVKEEVIKTMVEAPVSSKSATQKAADEFIQTYLTSTQGNIYAQANSLNCKNIISGLQAWNNLSASEKSAVNKTLQSEIGKTYQTLLKEAQAISYGSSTQTTPTASIYNYNYAVHTGQKTNVGVYAIICAVMAVLIGVFIKKRKDTK